MAGYFERFAIDSGKNQAIASILRRVSRLQLFRRGWFGLDPIVLRHRTRIRIVASFKTLRLTLTAIFMATRNENIAMNETVCLSHFHDWKLKGL